MTVKRKYYYLIGSIIGILLIAFFIRVFITIQNSKALSFNMPQEIESVFNKTAKSKIKIKAVYNSKSRGSIVTTDYENGRYSMTIFEIGSGGNFPLENIMVKKWESDKSTANTIYSVATNGYIDLNYVNEIPRDFNKIVLSYKGNSLEKVIATPTILGYRLNYEKVGISYNLSSKINGYLDISETGTLVPLSFTFLKHKGKIFLMVISANKYQDVIPVNLVSSMLALA